MLGTDAFVAHCHPATTSFADPDSWGEEVRLIEATFDMSQSPIARGSSLATTRGWTSPAPSSPRRDE